MAIIDERVMSEIVSSTDREIFQDPLKLILERADDYQVGHLNSRKCVLGKKMVVIWIALPPISIPIETFF